MTNELKQATGEQSAELAEQTAATAVAEVDEPEKRGLPSFLPDDPVDPIWTELFNDVPSGESYYGRNCTALQIVPAFGEFRGLSAPAAHLRALRNEELIQELEAEKEELLKSGLTSLASPELQALCRDSLNEPLPEVDTEQRRAQLSAAINQLVSDEPKYQRHKFLYSKTPAELFVQRVREIYRSPDYLTAELKADLDSILPKIEGESVAKKVEWIDDRIDGLRFEIDHKIFFKGFGRKFFSKGRVPNGWSTIRENHRYVRDESHQSKIDLTRRMCTEFFKLWRARAKHFNVPVSINCIDIMTMPHELRGPWWSLFSSAKIKPILFEVDRKDLPPTRFTPYHYSHTPRGWDRPSTFA